MNIRLEYSPDNGTKYLSIADCVPNTGPYEWLVPHHSSPHCLVRISSAEIFICLAPKSFRSA
ncbi:MAG TPA: hypothetical protein VK186_12385 [Candidatus Deferrimicrobium sp.]|nr:hypothetical protein [Candidatus Deferrimicrobium sp.]